MSAPGSGFLLVGAARRLKASKAALRVKRSVAGALALLRSEASRSKMAGRHATLLPILMALLTCGTFNLAAQEKGGASEAGGKAVLLQKIRDRIVWYEPEKIDPCFIPQDMLGLVPVEEMPIPETARKGIRQWIIQEREDRPAADPSSRCSFPKRTEYRLKQARERITLEEAMAETNVSLLVSIDSVATGIWPNQGIYHYNEVAPVEVLLGTKLQFQDPLATRAFLSEGGEVVIEGTALCSKSPWHREAPRKGDVYLLVGTPQTDGIFYTRFYFRVEEGNVLPADYPELKKAEGPLSLERLVADASKKRNSHD